MSYYASSDVLCSSGLTIVFSACLQMVSGIQIASFLTAWQINFFICASACFHVVCWARYRCENRGLHSLCGA